MSDEPSATPFQTVYDGISGVIGKIRLLFEKVSSMMKVSFQKESQEKRIKSISGVSVRIHKRKSNQEND